MDSAQTLYGPRTMERAVGVILALMAAAALVYAFIGFTSTGAYVHPAEFVSDTSWVKGW